MKAKERSSQVHFQTFHESESFFSLTGEEDSQKTAGIHEHHIQRLIQIESQVKYTLPPPLQRPPFIVVKRVSPVLLSAPHGTVSFRGSRHECWHEEDEYTAGIALLLGELCKTSVIASIWESAESDPNYHFEKHSPYKQEVRRLVQQNRVQWVIDLHGAKMGTKKMGSDHLVDLGTRKEQRSLNPDLVFVLKEMINNNLGIGNVVHENGFPAFETEKCMTITAFCHCILGIEAVQIEMKPQVRIPMQRLDSSSLAKGEVYPSNQRLIMGMLQGLADFIHYLNRLHYHGNGNELATRNA